MGLELGPFLCKPSQTSMGFWISASSAEEISRFSIQYWPSSQEKDQAKSVIFSGATKHFFTSIAIAEELLPDTQYSYEVLFNGNPEYCGLKPEAFTFQTLSENPDELEIMLMSCHGIEAYQNDPKTNNIETWNMWDRLLMTLKARPNCRIGLLGGDQVYMDDTFGDDLKKFNPQKPDEAQDKALAAYKKYWSEPVYRAVMARLPCLLMWDDHDIIDGWGSREEQFGKDKKKWSIYGEILYRAYDEMQASRNSGVLDQTNGSSFIYKTASTAVLGFDLRNTRGRKITNPSELEMLSEKAKSNIESAIQKLGPEIQHLFLLSPVTLARMGGSIEFFLGALSNFMWELMKWGGYGKTFLRTFYWTLIFSACYLILYIDIPELQGALQSFASFIILLIFVVGNWKNLTKYFPKGNAWIKTGIGLVLCGILGRIFYVLNQKDFPAEKITSDVTAWIESQWLSLSTDFWNTLLQYWQWLFSGPTDTRLGLALSISVIGYFAFAKSKSVQKWIGNIMGLEKKELQL